MSPLVRKMLAVSTTRTALGRMGHGEHVRR